MPKMCRPRSKQNIAMVAAAPAAPATQVIPDVVEKTIAPAAIERALTIYQQLQPRDRGDTGSSKDRDRAVSRLHKLRKLAAERFAVWGR